jgi:hypothetical protein
MTWERWAIAVLLVFILLLLRVLSGVGERH